MTHQRNMASRFQKMEKNPKQGLKVGVELGFRAVPKSPLPMYAYE